MLGLKILKTKYKIYTLVIFYTSWLLYFKPEETKVQYSNSEHQWERGKHSYKLKAGEEIRSKFLTPLPLKKS